MPSSHNVGAPAEKALLLEPSSELQTVGEHGSGLNLMVNRKRWERTYTIEQRPKRRAIKTAPTGTMNVLSSQRIVYEEGSPSIRKKDDEQPNCPVLSLRWWTWPSPSINPGLPVLQLFYHSAACYQCLRSH